MLIKPLVEALLFTTEEPLPPDKLAEIMGVAIKDVREALRQLQEEYSKAERGLQVMEIARGFQLGTKPELAPVLETMFKGEKSYVLSQAALETLAIIAYRQPVTRVDIESVRGVKVDGVLETLLKRRFVRTVGRKDAPGRPILYGTTKDFLKYFGLKDLSQLPHPALTEQ
ncbi:MAG: SMC-Scp complex subunit ScpB [Firmicutes bacterium]|nr:SMC-Scp complex subunit ScpB [Bacillota bacterium]MCL5994097.1 SMC-Scp complex subunit ScpB [Bacillota bacterium]